MNGRLCSVDQCGRPRHARGLCITHVGRLYRTGSVDAHVPIARGVSDRIKKYTTVDEATGCWNWTAYRNPKGYGVIQTAEGNRTAHRVSWELVNGPVPDGLELDHLCRNRACCNPEHLEAVTHAENMRRSAPATRPHCANGHALEGDNVVMHMDRGSPRRRCRTCARKRSRDYLNRKRLAAAGAA